MYKVVNASFGEFNRLEFDFQVYPLHEQRSTAVSGRRSVVHLDLDPVVDVSLALSQMAGTAVVMDGKYLCND